MRSAIILCLVAGCAYGSYHDSDGGGSHVPAPIPDDLDSGVSGDAEKISDSPTFDERFNTPSDATIAMTCPDICLDYGKGYNCDGVMIVCVAEWQPSWTQECYSTSDKRYCNLPLWTAYCATQKLACQRRCTDDCNQCVGYNGCMVASYACQEACQQETP